MFAVAADQLDLLTPQEMTQADRLAIAAGTAGIALMEAAGGAVADVVRHMLPAGTGRIVILCGPGNNGGDGFIAARLLREQGFTVTVGLLGDREKLTGDARLAADRWTGRLMSAALVNLDDADLVVDALFGAGLSRDLDGRARAIVERLNGWRGAHGRPVVAVDVPSGVDGATGAVRGVAVEADASVTFFRLKPRHLLLPGRELCGEITLAQIGIEPGVLAVVKPAAQINLPALWRAVLPVLQPAGHKYARGHALAFSGAAHRTGAARLSARAALRAGAGLVTLLSPRGALAINAAHVTAVMLAPCDNARELRAILADRRLNAIVLGPAMGVTPLTKALVLTALASGNGRAIVLDADALTVFADAPHVLFDAIATHDGPVVLTPHDGEFARLFDVAGGKLERARQAARESGAIVLIKGADTVVAHPDGRAAIACDLPPTLATAGSGDVLAGLICGLLAQAMPPFEATCAAVWLHGAAARHVGHGLIAEDLPEAMPAVWRELADWQAPSLRTK